MRARERTDWPMVLLLWAAGLLAAMQFAKVSLALPALAQAYPGREAVVPWAVSAVSLAGLVLGAAAGVLIARLGAGRAAAAALTASAALSLGQALMPPFPLFLALRALEGVAHLGLVVAVPVLMAGLASDRDRPFVMGLWAAFFGVGFALAAPAVAALLPLGGPGAVFAAHGAGFALLALALRGRMPAPALAAPEPRGGWLAEHRRLYATPRLAAPAAGFVWHALMFVALLTFLPGALGAGTALATALPLVSLAGTLIAGAAARRVAPLGLAALSFALTAVLCAALLAAPAALHAALALALFFTMGLAPGALFAAIPALNPAEPDRARASGALAQLGNVGTGTGTPLYAAALAGAGLPGLLLATLAAGLAGLAVLGLLAARLRRG